MKGHQERKHRFTLGSQSCPWLLHQLLALEILLLLDKPRRLDDLKG